MSKRKIYLSLYNQNLYFVGFCDSGVPIFSKNIKNAFCYPCYNSKYKHDYSKLHDLCYKIVTNVISYE